MPEYVRSANEDTCVILQVEHPAAVENIDEILAVPGIDVAYVGVADLASFMGFTGQIGELDASVDAAIDCVVSAAGKARVPLGIHCLSPEAAARRIRQGFRFMAIGGDARYIGGTARQQLQETKRLVR
jgi:4-hydroxy-2-oxoheptanedioate aldolase